jgi:hypothetical protein
MKVKLTSKQVKKLIDKGVLKQNSMTMSGKSAKTLNKHLNANKDK